MIPRRYPASSIRLSPSAQVLDMEIVELENGIFGMVVTLCRQKAGVLGDEAAREAVAAWLVEIATTLLQLQATENQETEQNGK